MYRFVEMFHSELTEADLEEELGPPGEPVVYHTVVNMCLIKRCVYH